MNSGNEMHDLVNGAGDALAALRQAAVAELSELDRLATKESLGTLAALATPFGIEEAVPGMNYDSMDASLRGRCSRRCDRADDCIVVD